MKKEKKKKKNRMLRNQGYISDIFERIYACICYFSLYLFRDDTSVGDRSCCYVSWWLVLACLNTKVSAFELEVAGYVEINLEELTPYTWYRRVWSYGEIYFWLKKKGRHAVKGYLERILINPLWLRFKNSEGFWKSKIVLRVQHVRNFLTTRKIVYLTINEAL